MNENTGKRRATETCLGLGYGAPMESRGIIRGCGHKKGSGTFNPAIAGCAGPVFQRVGTRVIVGMRGKVIKPVIGRRSIAKVKIILGYRIPAQGRLRRKKKIFGTGNNHRGLVAPAGLEGEELA